VRAIDEFDQRTPRPLDPTDLAKARKQLKADERNYEIRRLRDILRSNLFGYRYDRGVLPSESIIMERHGVRRSVVRAAIELLRSEGVIDRVQGLGTFSTTIPRTEDVELFNKTSGETQAGAWNGISRVELVAQKVIRTPDAVEANLPAAGPRCLLLEFVAYDDSIPLGVSTHYFSFPEADSVAAESVGKNFWRFLIKAGIEVTKSQTKYGADVADENMASMLKVPLGKALVTLEQVLFDLNGKPFNMSFSSMRADWIRMLHVSVRPTFLAEPVVGGKAHRAGQA
jgi:GntR family transcriptional regulator